MSLSFAVTFDYRCPFARNAHEHVLDGLEAGADWDVRFVAFSLDQVHVKEGEVPIWERPGESTGVLALQAGVTVRDQFPELFRGFHRALFAARHDEGRHIKEHDVVAEVLYAAGIDVDAALAHIESGKALEAVRNDHEAVAASHKVWGVPTFLLGDGAVFVRLMDRPRGDGDHARRTIERVLDLLGGWADLNEFKHTSIPR